MKILCAVDLDWAIGYKGELLYKIPQDLKRFKELTKGNIVVMGRKTLESLPGAKPLKDRTNIVVTTCKDYDKYDIITVHTLKDLMKLLSNYEEEEIFLIGGGELIASLIDYCDIAYITKINDRARLKDTAIPNLDKDKEWILVEQSQSYSYDGIEYRYLKYKRQK